jgi:hypothetical protein
MSHTVAHGISLAHNFYGTYISIYGGQNFPMHRGITSQTELKSIHNNLLLHTICKNNTQS